MPDNVRKSWHRIHLQIEAPSSVEAFREVDSTFPAAQASKVQQLAEEKSGFNVLLGKIELAGAFRPEALDDPDSGW